LRPTAIAAFNATSCFAAADVNTILDFIHKFFGLMIKHGPNVDTRATWSPVGCRVLPANGLVLPQFVL